MITDKIEQKYIKNEAGRCPFCNSKDLCASPVEVSGAVGSSNVYCISCKSEWVELWKLDSLDRDNFTSTRNS